MIADDHRRERQSYDRASDMDNGQLLSAEERWAALSLVAHHLVPLVSGAPDRSGALSETMVASASRHLVSPALGYCLAGPAMDEPLRDYFGATLTLNRARNETILAGLDLLLAAFAESGIVPMAMKGAAALLHGIYPDIGARIVGDLDLLVDEEQVPDAIAAAERAGFVIVPGQRVIPWHHHAPLMAHATLGTGVELHRRPLAETRIVTSECLLRAAIPRCVNGLPILLPAATDMVAHLVVHSQVIDRNHHCATVPMRYLLELALIVERFGDDLDWADVTERFAQAGQTEALAMTCAASDHFFGPRTPFAHRADDAAMWLRRGLGRSIAWRWVAEFRHRLHFVPMLARHEPTRLLNALRPSRWQNVFRTLPERW